MNNAFSEMKENKINTQNFKRLGSYLLPYKSVVVKLLMVIIFSNIVLILGPYLTSYVIDTVIPTQNRQALVWVVVIYTVATILNGLATRYRILNITTLGQDVLRDIRSDLFNHMQEMSFKFFDSRPHGKILTRIVNYINSLSNILSSGLITVISDILSIVVTLIIMVTIDPVLTLYSFLLLPLLFIVTLVIKNKQRLAYEELSEKQSNLNAYIHESIEGIKTTQSYTREDMNFDIFADVSDQQRTSWMKAVRMQFLLGPIVQVIATVTISFIYYAGIKSLGVNVSTGVLIAFVAYVNNFWNPIINLGNFYNSLVSGTVYLDRVFEMMDLDPLITEAEDAFEMPPVKGDVVFRDVTFGYQEGQPIFEHLSFHVQPGETIALVGPTGAGKSTITNLISRFYDIQAGQILIDGIDIRDVTLKSLRHEVGVMLQDTFIFSGTIMDNIRYGKLDATEEEIIEAAKVVRAHDFIKDLKEGYHTIVQERGSTLSAGQRQLISFARTLLADPKVLILDEATSSIDTQTEILLQEGLDYLLEGRTAFIVAHRLSTIRNSDRIFFIGNRQILESGSHAELISQKGRYYDLYRTQSELLKKM
ncbi:MAG TPA: ABC transporter ATP-binding protein/permease [Candidatus Jeotgalibaca merdavium]|uniref:ABC transporter ATP-binding protein n=2 Tax=Jeotgalibaca TaxID=1470540 RepID=A0A6G7K8M0_9LACT|nr:ABC transporter ATP-binding protein [Jeotgalibaca arthritidis]QII81614.1 ABC transporter ATP-binding protein [Jeotgalibaca arthritidis]HJA90306.1 ABC transporter ATP-binding protein/permease [Candidatus Jeotgalibaca merdavium]